MVEKHLQAWTLKGKANNGMENVYSDNSRIYVFARYVS